FINAGLLEAATPASIWAALDNTGTVLATSGPLDLGGGGVLGGSMITTGSGEIALVGGTFTVGGPALTIACALALGPTAAVDIASGQTLTLSGAVTWAEGGVFGPGTLATTGTTA